MATGDCKHQNFGATVNVVHLEDTGRTLAEISVWCEQCRLPFSFVGLPLAISTDRATLNLDGTKVTLPLEPGPRPIPVSGSVPVEMPRRTES